jgi:hypothetical protein
VVPNQGLQGIAFFEATACLTLLVLFIHLRKDNASPFYRLWLLGWISLTVASFSELILFFEPYSIFRLVIAGATMAAFVLFLASIVQLTAGNARLYWPVLWLSGLLALIACYYESRTLEWIETRWETAILQSVICLASGWLLWRANRANSSHGAKLLAGAFTLLGLNNMDRPYWTHEEVHLFRFVFDHFLNASLGIGMIVLLLENARTRTEEISEKMRQFTMLTATSSQSVSLNELLNKVLAQIVSSLNASHGMIRLLEGKSDVREFAVRASVGFTAAYLK